MYIQNLLCSVRFIMGDKALKILSLFIITRHHCSPLQIGKKIHYILYVHIETVSVQHCIALKYSSSKNGLIKLYRVWPTMYRQNKMHITFVACATYEFQKYQKSAIFKTNAWKNNPKQDFKYLVFFKSARSVLTTYTSIQKKIHSK